MSLIPVNDLARRSMAEADLLSGVIGRVIRTGWFVHGTEHASFEVEFAAYLGVAHCVATGNGTDALQLAIQAVAGQRSGVIVTAANAGGYAAIAAARAGREVGFVDVDQTTLCMSADSLAAAVAETDVAAVVVTHLFGRLADMARIMEVCSSSAVPVIEDCAQAVGARADRMAGGFGAVGTFSFYPTKNLGALGDGGAVVTDDEGLAHQVRRLRQYGWADRYVIDSPGGQNSRLDEMQAAVLRTRLGSLDASNARRRLIVETYRKATEGTAIQVLDAPQPAHVAHIAAALCNRRDFVRQALEARGVATDVHYPIPDHKQPLRLGRPVVDLPITEEAATQVFSIPCYPELTDEEVHRVAEALRDAARLVM
jgi:dTDP-4-amino-4,6-dideoxygalactose transaminase